MIKRFITAFSAAERDENQKMGSIELTRAPAIRLLEVVTIESDFVWEKRFESMENKKRKATCAKLPISPSAGRW